jgi:type IV pilus assembly protein PilB
VSRFRRRDDESTDEVAEARRRRAAGADPFGPNDGDDPDIDDAIAALEDRAAKKTAVKRDSRAKRSRAKGDGKVADEDADAEEEAPSPPRHMPRTPDEVEVDPKGGRLGEVLLRKGMVDKALLVEAILQQDATGMRLGSLLVASGAISEDELTEVVAEQAGVEVLDARNVEPEPAAVARLSETVARSLVAVPVTVQEDGTVDIAVSDPSPQTLQRLEKAVKGPVRMLAAGQSVVRRLLDTSFRAVEAVPEFVERFQAADSIRRAVEAVPDDAGVEDAPIVQVVNLMITQALRDRASDIHLEPTDSNVRLRYRIDGALHDLLSLPGSMALALVSRIKIMAGLNIVERRRPQDGQISMEVENRELDIRVAVAPTIWGEKVVLRLLDKSRPLFQYHELGMSGHIEKKFLEVIQSPYGMVACAGPTGSGKTTTLYATLLALNDSELNITTIEDPVEYILPAINQIQVNPAADVTFVSGLRSVLRQDPDIILVGETRDTETAQIAVRAALTGHLVLSSIHATDSASAVQRFIEMGVEPFLLTSSLVAVVAQRLVRRICTYCKEPYEPGADEMAFYSGHGGAEKSTFYRGTGCAFCARSGYLGRIGVFELLTLSDEIREAIVTHANRDQIRALAKEQGMNTLRDEGLRLVAEDHTTIAEIVRHIWTM